MTREVEQRRQRDDKRRDLKPWRKWYSLKAWRTRRRLQLDRVPWCEPCKRLGMSRIATIANHVTPHRGVWSLFISGRLESTCKNCHDSAIQAAEKQGFRRDLDDDGWPADPAHPFNRK